VWETYRMLGAQREEELLREAKRLQQRSDRAPTWKKLMARGSERRATAPVPAVRAIARDLGGPT
jgi:hypothetical protein